MSAVALVGAASYTYTQVPLFGAVDSNSSTFALPQFSPLQGHLSSVTVSFSDATFTAAEVVNLSTMPETVACWSMSTVNASISSGAYSKSDTVTALAYYGTDATGTAAGSGLLAGGASNISSDSNSSTLSYTYADHATLDDFIGLGNVVITDSLVGDGFTDANGPQFGFIVKFGSAQSSITYTTTPGPAAAGTMLIGLGLAISRRWKS